MTVVSGLTTRAANEINDTTSNTFSSSLTGFGYSELTQYAIDGIADYSYSVFRESFANSIVTSANTRAYVVSALSPTPLYLTRVEYVETSTSIWQIPDVELWNGSMYLFYHDQPLFTTADKYFNIWYLARHTIPGAASATITVPTQDEEIIVNYIKWKAFAKMGADQRGITQDTTNEFLSLAQSMQQRYKEQLKRASTPFINYR